jgi:hypothetical protein
MKENNCSNKLKYKECLKLIYECLSDDMYIDLTSTKIPYNEMICVYEKANVTVF